MNEFKDFDVIRVCRSDGSDTGPGYWPVTAPAANSAKKLAAEKAPRAKPQMTRLAEDDPRFTEWRVKLGILLKQELSQNPEGKGSNSSLLLSATVLANIQTDGNAWYVPFPKGYWLYEKSKHLWVSGYPIKAKLFKTPQEFALHLIWLLSASMDYKDCCCVLCNVPSLPKQIPVSEDSMSSTPNEQFSKPETIQPKVTPVPVPTIVGQAPPTQTASPISRSQSAQSQTTPSITPPTANVANPTQPPAVPPIAPRPSQPTQTQVQPPQPQTNQLRATQPQTVQPQTVQPQMAQSQPAQAPTHQWPPMKSPFLFRVGELVWYQNGQTWRLGVVSTINQAQVHELLAIGHNTIPQQSVLKPATDMRPFHAFSVPGVAIPDLKNKNYDDIPWEAMFASCQNDPNKRDLLALDASKMAASKIDYSFSLWSQLEDPSGKSPRYYGCFLGAERIEVGDGMRLRSLPVEWNMPSETAVLGLRVILTNRDYPGAVFFHGHVYVLAKGNSMPGNGVPEDQLPAPLRNEVAWRNQVSPGSRWRWVLVRENAVIKEQSIRGRFYPTHRLMPVLNPASFQQAMQQGQGDDQMLQLNNRMDVTGRYIGRKKNRLDTLGPSVSIPHNTRLSLEAYIKEE